MKQTALEWLQGTWLNYPDLCTYEKIQEWFDRAKAMEKEQIEDAFDIGTTDEDRIGKEYYNETYKK